MLSNEKLKEIEDAAQEFLSELDRLKQARMEGAKTSSPLPLYDNYPLLSDPRVFEELMSAVSPPEERVGLANLMGVIADCRCMRPFVEAQEEISRISESATLLIGEEEVPYSASESWLMRQKDRDLREVMEKERRKVLREINSYLAQAHDTAHEKCMELGFSTMEQMWQSLRLINFQELRKNCEALLSETQDTFSDHLRWLSQRRAGLDAKKLKRHDVLYIFASNEFDRLFPHRDAKGLLMDTMEEMGLPCGEMQNLKLEAPETREATPWPLCLPLKAPERVILFCPPGGGLSRYLSLFQELGRALFYAHISPDLPFGFRRIGEPAIPQMYAFLFGSLLTEPLWLRRNLGIQKESDLIRAAYVEKLYSVRAQVGRLIYELEIQSQAPSGEGSMFRDAMHLATGVDYPEERSLTDIPPWFKSATNLLAWSLEARFRRRLMEEMDEDWFRNPDTGDLLKSIWAKGFVPGLEAAAPGEGPPTDLAPLIEDLLQHLP